MDQGRQKEDYRQTVMSLDSVGFKEYYKLVGQFATAYKIGCWKEYSECEPILIEELGEELGRREKTKEKLELINSFRLEELRSQTFSFDAKINALQDILDDFRVGNEKEEVINRLLASFSGKDSGAFIARLQSDRKLLNGLLGRVNYIDLWGLLASEQKNIITSYGFGFKMALGVGLGFEVGYIEAGETKGIYITGSYGVGVQVSTGNYSSIKELVKSPSPRSLFSPSIGTGSVTIGTETSETVDIGVGIVGTWDLNNLNKSGLPNSWSGGSVGGGYWYNSTTILKIGRDEK